MKFNPGMGNMNQMMKQAQKMQKEMAKAQEEVQARVVEASSGGGAVTVQANGQQQIVSIKIKPEVIDPEDIEMLEDLVMAAVNEALKQTQDMMAQEMGKITGGMNIPGLF